MAEATEEGAEVIASRPSPFHDHTRTSGLLPSILRFTRNEMLSNLVFRSATKGTRSPIVEFPTVRRDRWNPPSYNPRGEVTPVSIGVMYWGNPH